MGKAGRCCFCPKTKGQQLAFASQTKQRDQAVSWLPAKTKETPGGCLVPFLPYARSQVCLKGQKSAPFTPILANAVLPQCNIHYSKFLGFFQVNFLKSIGFKA